MRTKLICLLALVVAVATGSAGAGDNVPLKGKDTFSSNVIGGSGTSIQTADNGSGTATHLGRYTMAASETVDLVAMTVTNGVFTLTTANGDTVNGSYSGTILPGLAGYLVSGPITGGTGRFADATGTITFNGTFNPRTGTGSDLISGAISTVGASS